MKRNQLFPALFFVMSLVINPIAALAQNKNARISDQFMRAEFMQPKYILSNNEAVSFLEYLGRKLDAAAHHQPAHKNTALRASFVINNTMNAYIELPSSYLRNYAANRNLFQVSVPSNWQVVAEQDSFIFFPRGGYVHHQGRPIFTYGTVAGVAISRAKKLQQATDEYISVLLRNDSYLNSKSNYRHGRIGGSDSLSVTIQGRSPISGQEENITLHTAFLQNGKLFYVINVMASNEAPNYDQVFAGIVNSIVLNQ